MSDAWYFLVSYGSSHMTDSTLGNRLINISKPFRCLGDLPIQDALNVSSIRSKRGLSGYVDGSLKKRQLLLSKQNTTVDMSELNEIGAAIISLTEFPVMLEN